MQLPFKRLWLHPSQFLSRKVAYCHPRAGFCVGAKKQTPLAPHSETFNGDEGVKTIRQAFCLLNTATADLFLFQRGKVEAGRPLAVPGWPHKELWGGHPNQQQKTVRRRLSAVNGSLRTIRPNQQREGLKKSWNSWASKMIRIEVILPCAFDSEHTSKVWVIHLLWM
jgi:hypothetical protein